MRGCNFSRHLLAFCAGNLPEFFAGRTIMYYINSCCICITSTVVISRACKWSGDSTENAGHGELFFSIVQRPLAQFHVAYDRGLTSKLQTGAAQYLAPARVAPARGRAVDRLGADPVAPRASGFLSSAHAARLFDQVPEYETPARALIKKRRIEKGLCMTINR